MPAAAMTPLDYGRRASDMTCFLIEIFETCESESRKSYYSRPIFLTEEGRAGLQHILRRINDDIYHGALEDKE